MKTNLLFICFLTSQLWSLSYGQTRLVIDPQAHNGVVNDMLFTSNGKYLISVSDDKTIRIWDVENKQLDRTLRTFAGEGAEGAIYALALSPDDRFLAIGGYFKENEIRIVDLKKSAKIITLKGHTNVVTSIEFSYNGLQLASSDVTGVINLWDISYDKGQMIGKLINTLQGHKAQVYDISFSPNAEQLVSASYDGSLQLWDLTGVEEPIAMRMHIDKVYSCTFSADGKWIISGGNKGKAILWNNRGVFSKYLDSLEEPIHDIAAAGNTVLISTTKGYKYSLANFSDKKELPLPFSQVSASAISSANVAALAGGASGTIILYDLATSNPYTVFRNKSNQPTKIGISNNAKLVFKIDRKDSYKGIDLANFTFLWELDSNEMYFSELHQDNGYTLSAFDKYTLSTGFKGTVNMNPKLDGRLRSYSIINDETIAVGGDFSLKLYTRNAVLKGELKGFNGAVTSIASANNKIVAICGDQTIRVWNLTTFELIASLYLAPKLDWICWTPQGYYEASSGGEKYMGWQVDKEVSLMSEFYKSSVFSLKYHQPELLKQALALESFAVAFEKVKLEIKENNSENRKVTVEKEEGEEVIKSAPIVNWLTPEFIASEQNQPKITIKAIVKSTSKIKTAKILINGRPATKTRGVAIPKTVGEFDMLIEQELILPNDVNEIRIFVANQEAKMVSEKRVINLLGVDNRGEGRSFEVINYSDRPDLYILSIGVSAYANAAFNLNFADRDAIAVAEVFSSLGTEAYKDVHNVQILNQNATKTGVLDAFELLSKKVQPKDMVLVFIASHGINNNGQFYIMPYDSDLKKINQTLLSWQDIAALLGNLPSKVLVFIDACKSGQLGVNVANYNANNTEAVREAASDENGVVIMAASTGNETALESAEWEHGAFTMALLEGLKSGKADIKPDGTIYLRELDFYVSERTIELTNNSQHPTTQKPSTISRLTIINLNK